MIQEIINFLNTYIKAHGCTEMNKWVAFLEQLGWHPANELPKEDGEYITIMSNSLGEHGEICFNDFSNEEWRYTGYDWEPREVLLWCYPPKEDKK